ncbi:4075_t:CDS:2, partial [Rhizophagus irregularis]
GEELKLRIKATQLEKERTEMLICDYIGDSVQSSRPRNVQSQKEKIWELAHLLINAFESLNPLENPVFEFCNNLNDDGVNQLIIAYDIGIKRLQTIANQEIFLTESYTTIGRRARNITRAVTSSPINTFRWYCSWEHK